MLSFYPSILPVIGVSDNTIFEKGKYNNIFEKGLVFFKIRVMTNIPTPFYSANRLLERNKLYL